ncbi:MAG: 5'-methylthioadenosine/adenosylhomocysteine nucleosidase [Spirochaetaceae bacterium]|nr:5'-methylthioadenosine/adenosylhomocysteine nucleosidase [Spirochaetaceae bacterium]
MKVGIIGAMDVEVAEIISNMTEKKTTDIGHLQFVEGFIGKIPVVIVQSGVGKVNAGICTQTLILQFGVTCVINTGIAGGIAQGLSVMDTVISIDAIYHDFDATEFGYRLNEVPGLDTIAFPADEKLIELAEKTYEEGVKSGRLHRKAVKGRVATGDIFVNSSIKKSALKAMCNPACVEMEGAAIAHVCHLNTVPFVIIRCISDLAENTTEVYLEKEAALENAYLVMSMIKNM